MDFSDDSQKVDLGECPLLNFYRTDMGLTALQGGVASILPLCEKAETVISKALLF